MNYTSISNYLRKCIENNYHCQHCAINHNGTCFFAFECFMDNMKYYNDDEDNYIPDDVDETNYDPYCGSDMFEICDSIDEEW